MRLLRFGAVGKEKPGVLIDETRYDVSGLGEDYTNDFFANNGLKRLRNFVKDHQSELPIISPETRLGVPLANPSKILCVGLNFEDHVKETGLEQAHEPILFLKAISALTGPADGITIPKGSTQTDWETELAIVIGKKATYIREEDAEEYIAGYVLHNDVSERTFQTKRGGTWDKGKGCDTFAPVGPYLVTKEEIKDVNNMRIWLKRNGELMQNGNTKDFIYKIPKLLAYMSQFFSLNPGDIISTGSPAGAGMGKHPQVFLKPGDIIEYGIEGLGQTTQVLHAYAPEK